MTYTIERLNLRLPLWDRVRLSGVVVECERITPAALWELHQAMAPLVRDGHRWIVRVPPEMDSPAFVGVSDVEPRFLGIPIEVNELLPANMVLLAPPSVIEMKPGAEPHHPPRILRWVDHHLCGLLVAGDVVWG